MILHSFKAFNNKLELINEKGKYNITFLLIMSFSYFLPIHQKISTLLLLAIALVSLIRIKHFNFKIFKFFIPLILLYILYAIAYYRDNFEFVSLMFERKAILLALPLAFSTFKMNKEKLKMVLLCFVYGCISAYLFSMFYATFQSISFSPFNFEPLVFSQVENGLGNPNASIVQSTYFLGNNFVLDMNVNILAIYFSFSVGIILTLKNVFSSLEKKILIIILVLGIFQLFSILGIAALLFVYITTYKPKLIKPILGIVLLGFLTLLVVIKNKENIKNYDIENFDRRVIIWDTALTCIKEHFIFGIGAKKAQRELEKHYPKTGEFGYASQINKLDAHNMYLQFILEIGIIGLFIYMVYIFNYFKAIIKRASENYKSIAIIFMSLILLLNFTESAFNIYVGISFLVFFSGLFFISNFENLNDNSQKI